MDSAVSAVKKYCNSLIKYSRRETIPVKVGDIIIGGNNPIVVQSMTTVDTMDTLGSVEETLRMVASGCELVRITAPSLKEAENLRNIKAELRKRGCNVPLVADIHFTPNAAELAAQIVEKVRVNPGNYADKKKFENIEYTDITYQAELDRIRERFSPLVEICKDHGTAMRIGTNHGSLSDRILSRYGDTALGMVESALEFLRICEDLDYYNIVLSMKSSNTQVMVEAYRLLVQKLDEEGLKPYPLHLGVTEAGEAEDGRIKSAVGIGTLLEDGLGDTVRVSLTEAPEYEAPVAQKLVDRYKSRAGHTPIPSIDENPIDPFLYHKRLTREVQNIGASNVPRVIADLSQFEEVTIKDLKNIGHFYLPEPDKWRMNDQGADFVYSGSKAISFMLPNGLKELIDYPTWNNLADKRSRYPVFTLDQLADAENADDHLNFVKLNAADLDEEVMMVLEASNLVVILATENEHAMPALRRFFFELTKRKLNIPVLVSRNYTITDAETFLIHASTDIGGLLVDGFGDGIMLQVDKQANKENQLADLKLKNETGFGILQAARTRMTKTEYISCPSCGRTLFDLQETTAMIRKRTDHLKGVKIGIMGCIVNGPGEMADADYGYVGSGKGKITLYKGQEVMKRSVPSENAVNELIEIIKEDGKWLEPELVNQEI
ncbi:MAG: 4-hydroxy-3-methylbut-2-en-1-yl diphosphate synthase [Cytophagales bacterium CG12_big_fil_rev_8_21_14_0_65_40_12]|nr:MAG: 4-hydroxy-3-methylbut-2-en-1-yl diphosphate synthase [Cytophagales bacterium CG12_big_fil_rev_8_21_14_0_65_40_12]PIW05193.1 MAG: 4-hydroxy-3-methylbut-2-en-1-yl diphosphate synthase [Cytophagales bacterium CG17_big_fil_post_rev_8_21_14_2_50_40_13]